MKPFHLFIAISITCLWGFNFSVIKAGVDNMDPFILAGLRFTFASLPLVFFIKRPHVSWLYLISYGILFGVGVWGLMSLSMSQGLSAGMSGVILELSAFISVIFGVLLLKEKLKAISIFGLCISFAGLLLVFQIEDGSVTTMGILLATCAALSLSLVSLMIKTANISAMFSFVVWSSLFAPIPLFITALLVNGQSSFIHLAENLNFTATASVLFQAYPTTVLGYWLWNKLLNIYPLTTMAPLKLLIPIFALLGSVIFYNEQIQGIKLIACTLIVSGVSIPIVYELFIKHIANFTKRTV